MRHTTTRVDSPRIEPVPPPEMSATIGGRADTWTLPQPADEDERFEPTIIRGRE